MYSVPAWNRPPIIRAHSHSPDVKTTVEQKEKCKFSTSTARPQTERPKKKRNKASDVPKTSLYLTDSICVDCRLTSNKLEARAARTLFCCFHCFLLLLKRMKSDSGFLLFEWIAWISPLAAVKTGIVVTVIVFFSSSCSFASIMFVHIHSSIHLRNG